MKKLFKRGLALMLGLVAATGAFAQEMPQLQPLPADTAVRIGVLPNGLTYYIRHNATPKGQADFYIAQKVGSILEEENQRGLAHFLEHMCFNGTENFPGKGIINWLESVGVKFGQNLNAYTSVDETVYNISSVPVARQSVQDSCLLILHDWASALTLDPAEIDAERGVIHEEWRRSMAGQMRILEEQLPVIFPDSKYGHRLPIGTMEVVDNFPPQAIIDYYHTWYRPDQQGIIVVGDIDPDYIEAKIKEIFTPIQMPANAKERTYLPVEDTPGTIYAIGKDKEMSAPVALLFFKTDAMPREMRNTQMYYPVKYTTDVVCMMLNNRLSDLANTADAPFAQASVEYGDFFVSKTKDALTVQVVGKGNDITQAVNAVYRELLRAARGGFTQGEFERANAEIRSNYQRLYDSRNNTPTDRYSREYVRAFIDNEPIPGVEFEKQIMDALTSMVPVEQVNQILPQLVTDDNRAFLFLLPDAEGFVIPTEEQVAAGIEAVDAETLEPYKDTMREDPLIPALPAPGKIVSEKADAQWGATEYTLSNGLKVLVKPTTFKDNDIQLRVVAKGGTNTLPASDAPSLIFMPYASEYHGLGDYSNSDLKKYLQGKQVSLNVSLEQDGRTISGTSTVQDLPTLFELLYANFTEFSFKPEEFAAAQSAIKGVLANQESTPEFAFQKLIMSTLFKAPAAQMITTSIIDQANCETSQAIVRHMLANAKDFTFILVGNLDPATLKPLLEQYVATLPTTGESVAYIDNPDFEPVRGTKTTEETTVMATPQTWAMYLVSGMKPYTIKDKMISGMVGQIMSKRLLNKVREEMGATYSIGASSSMGRLGEPNFSLQIAFPMKPEMRAEVNTAIENIMAAMTSDITAEELNPVKEFMVKEYTSDLEENTSWIAYMAGWALNGVDTFNGQKEVIESITIDDVQNFWKSIRAQGNEQIIMLNPAE